MTRLSHGGTVILCEIGQWFGVSPQQKATSVKAMFSGIVIDGQHLALYRLGGEFYATSNICSHEFALLSDGFVEDGRIECPLHAAQFDIRTGKVLCAPATTSIATWPVKLENNQVLVDI